jgi:hypothetical protein
MGDGMSEIEAADGKRYAPVGHCIYCGSTSELSDEHTIPYGLGGTIILPKASCKPCSKITGAIEQRVMRGPMRQVRVFRDLQSRTKHKDAPKTKTLAVTLADGSKTTAEMGFTEGPVMCAFPVFALPGFVEPAGYENGIRISRIDIFAFGENPAKFASDKGFSSITITENHKYVDFARMLAKIAYSTAVGQAMDQGVKLLDGDPFVLPAILGQADDIGRWVGTFLKPFERHEGRLHRVEFGMMGDTDTLISEVQVFADSGTPLYGVILGKAAK